MNVTCAVGTCPFGAAFRRFTSVKTGFSMSEQPGAQETDQLAQVNTELTRSLKLCQSIVDDYRSKLGAKLNHAEPANDDEDSRPD
jgi:hypothetical protein